MSGQEEVETEVAKIQPEAEDVQTEDTMGQAEELCEVEEEESDRKKKARKEKEKRDKKGKRKDKGDAAVGQSASKKKDSYKPVIPLPGLKSIRISNQSQKAVGCVVGEAVTTQAPWVDIQRATIEEHMAKYSTSSDFHPVKQDLKQYKESHILVGYDPNFEPDPEEEENFHYFFVAISEEARATILARLDEDRRVHEERLKNSVNKTILPWVSLGSELDVDFSIPVNTRPLIEMEMETSVTDLLKPVQFTDAKDTCVKIGPGRTPFTGIRKLRVDASVQAIPPTIPGCAQTVPGLPVNAWSQYVYDLETAQQAAGDSVKDLPESYLFEEQDHLIKALEFNETFDLYTNDYPLLVLREGDDKVPCKSVFEEYQAFTNVTFCKGLMCSAMSWHPMWTGVVAVAYSYATRNVPGKTEEEDDDIMRDTFSKNPILIWSFKDFLHPKLILECPREVLCLSWCPTLPNILVAGAVSGQLIIYDLTGRLEEVEGHEYLAPDQQRYRQAMNGLLGWVRPDEAARFVRPAAMSSLQHSHNGRVTAVQWLPPYHELTESGHFKQSKQAALQVVSCGEDGSIMFWDLNKEPPQTIVEENIVQKKARKRPSVQTMAVSKFKPYDRTLRPIYTLAMNPADNIVIFTAISIKAADVKYSLKFEPEDKEGASNTEEKLKRKEEAKDEDEEGNDFVKEEEVEFIEPADSLEVIRRDSLTYREVYVPLLEDHKEVPAKRLQVATDSGECLQLSWDGFDLHKGQDITAEEPTVISVGTAVHDGPVVACARSSFIKELLLTVGGKVVALWHDSFQNKPLWWKYRPGRCTSASWSCYRPAMFHVGREDGTLEAWDFVVRSDEPILSQSISGQQLTVLATHTLPLFGDKSVLGVGDFNNSVRLLFYPTEFRDMRPKELELMEELVQREITIRKEYEKWNEEYLRENAEELERIRALEEEEEMRKEEARKMAEAEAAARAKLEEDESRRLGKRRRVMSSMNKRMVEALREEQEKYMEKVLVEKKRVDMSDLLAKQQPILIMKQMEKDKKEKQKKKIENQNNIFEKTIAMFFPEVAEKPKAGKTRSELVEEEIRSILPDIEQDFLEVKKEKLQDIKDHPFDMEFQWKKIFEEGRKRREVLDVSLYLRQQRQDRYHMRKKHRLLHPPPPPEFNYNPGMARRETRRNIDHEDIIHEINPQIKEASDDEDNV